MNERRQSKGVAFRVLYNGYYRMLVPSEITRIQRLFHDSASNMPDSMNVSLILQTSSFYLPQP